ncbi:D-alanine--D-alanine ligase family protein [Enhygromyxa salina]|uniref:D-alanine--D-alanine ligase n=1 Tax=Enhygromyxa salina TaxID=215803 RepID=A0A2S9YXU7_9BACT|nr:D-alanine--D-alanine ligase [Enhygromyxa salina]PRQ09889.1 D-alanine--D-alanine ligase [Enhygromyxa salina]
MRIAFTHNLQLSDAEEEAEFDTPATVEMITRALRNLGHEVEPLEVSGPASRVVARLEALAPDLVFNTAEGSRGRFREAFFPALFDRLSLPFTGSDAWVCALTLDKHLSKLLVQQHGVKTPRWRFVERMSDLDGIELQFPVIAKPNYEGSSKGVTVDSVVEDLPSLRRLAFDLLGRFPSGLLVEEFIVGRDIVVPFLEKASPQTGGVLTPASYRWDAEAVAGRKYQLYDYELKTTHCTATHVDVPAVITDAERDEAMRMSHVAFRALGCRDVGRIDLRLAQTGELYFIEINALPSLEAGASIYASAKLVGLETPEAVLGTVVESAAERYGLKMTRKKRRPKIRVGLAYNLRRTQTTGDGGADVEAEYDTPETISALKQAIASHGHEVVDLEATPELVAILPASGVDVVFNVAEGTAGRFREAQVPALLELLGIPYTGSDPTALSLGLDKSLAKKVVRQAGFLTPDEFVMITGKERLPKGMNFPVIIKPLAEGSSKGILDSSVCVDEAGLREVAQRAVGTYGQAMLVETYLPGREFTVALLGERRPRVLPPMEILFTADAGNLPIYSFASKFESKGVAFECPAKTDPALGRELERVAKGVFTALGCRDVARVDLRLDANGRVCFIECNPLPGLSPGFSDMCVIAEKAGIDYRTLVGEILAPALRRLRHQQRQRSLAGRLS